jgi:hypothetical protein
MNTNMCTEKAISTRTIITKLIRSPQPPAQMQQLVEEKSHASNFTMLIDPRGALGRRFNVQDRPTYLLVDSKGKIRRRFIGIRTELTLQAMVDELQVESAAESATSR